ncbi:MAG TPA: sulfotransferase [Devosia sp.]|nr:sulfotransferase [Devosia sp.]
MSEIPVEPLAAFAPLDYLKHVAEGRLTYYRRLVYDEDPYISTGALAELISGGGVEEADWPRILDQCSHAFIRHLAVEYFELLFEHDLARRAATTASSEPEDPRRTAMLARIDFDRAASVRAEAEKFYANGAPAHLVRAGAAAESVTGWAAALPWCVRALVLSPNGPDFAGTIYLLLIQSSQSELIAEFRRHLSAAGLHREFDGMAEGAIRYLRKDYAGAVEILRDFNPESMSTNAALAPLTNQAQIMRAEAYDRLGNYRASYAEFAEANARGRDRKVNPAAHYESLKARKALQVPPLPPDPRSDVFQMLGFPRSGTTLLENALAAHPAIETFEEIPSHKAAAVYIFGRPNRPSMTESDAASMYLQARKRYYAEIDIRRRKPEATVLIDKLPLQSGDASFMKRLFPERRYIFSIRHPFDVVLSCFRQQFAPNASMENFRTIEDSIRIYDFTMQQWFETFTLESPEVCYVRYEPLVEDFEGTLHRVLSFLGVAWKDDVNNFADLAERRGFKTPSYQKVRQGLSIGVQTYWRNYGFLFQSFEAEPLRRWARFFGYPTS